MRDDAPQVTVVIPTLDRRDVLPACLGGVAAQSHPRLEIIVVDDGSTDGTPEYLEEFARAHPELDFRWLRHDTNLGANRARNAGTEAASGEVVVFLDSDAVPAPDWIERLVEGFEDESVAAVTGRVDEPEPQNVYELAYKGTHLVHRRGGEAARLVAGNLAIRRDLLLALPLEEDLKYGCNEEGIFLRLRALGYSQRLAPDAVILHDHPYDRAEFFRRARILGRASAWLVYKYRLSPRVDLLPFLLAYGTLGLAVFEPKLLWAAAAFFAAANGALVWNDLSRKRKTVSETARSFPALLAFYHVKLWGHVVESLRLRLRTNPFERVDLRAWARTSVLRCAASGDVPSDAHLGLIPGRGSSE
jgi:glycosyltransferase involved in cell wall biosynthesis